jgi:CRP/FNR family transcriptional regulator, cyclic AMP receptor protein
MAGMTGERCEVDPVVDPIDRFWDQIGVGPSCRDQLESRVKYRDVAAGTVLFRENSTSDELLLVLSGRVALEMNVPGRGGVRIISLGDGDLVGWSAVLAEGVMTTSAIALTQTRLAVFSATEIKAMCDRRPEIGYPLMRHIAQSLANRLVATRLQLLDLFGGRAT